MNDERCDRDRVTAILTLADEGLHYDVCKSVGTSYPCTCDAWRDIPWLASVALEALNTIDRVNALFAGGPDTSCRTVWDGEIECVSVPIEDLRQALNGGNE